MGHVISAETFFTKLLDRKIKCATNEIRIPKTHIPYETAVMLAMRHTSGLLVQQDEYLFTRRRDDKKNSRSVQISV